jgi:hypothetical protein
MADPGPYDSRLTPVRPDIAAKYLEGKVEAARFVTGEEFEISDGIAPMRHEPFSGAALDTQALRGEHVTVYDRDEEGWAWAQLHSDGYVGWLPDLALYPPGPPPTHKVSALRTFVFPGPSIKLPPVDTLPLGARISVVNDIEGFVVTREGHHLPASHVVSIDIFEQDFVAVAERFVGTPYLWGGKSSLGIDCSGLVQVALTASGIGCPRDSDMQRDGLGQDVPMSKINALKRGDLIFWKGHVAIARDARTLVHANAFHMATEIEPTNIAVERIAASGASIVAIKRLE